MKSLIRILTVLGSIAAALLAGTAQAQPANDQFANAITLNGPIVTTMGSNVGATKPFGGPGGGEPSIPPPSLGTFGGASVWWNWTAAASGQTTIDTEGSDFNTLLGVFTGAAANQLTLVAGNDNFEANQWSRVVFDAVAGTTYRIMVDGFRSGPGFGAPATGNIKLNVKGVGGLTITTPTNGMVFTVGDLIPVAVTIDADFPNPPATRVDFFLGDSLFASSATPPFTAIASNAPAGSNRVYVIAYDAGGTPIQSAVIPIFVQSIGVTLLTPFDGTTYLSTNPITVTAWSYLPAGAMTNIEFFVNGQKFGEDTEAPYSAVWSNVVGGSHRFTAVGRSSTGAPYNSQPVNIAVAQILLASNSVWKYLDDNSDQGTAWYAPDFDDSAWASGPAPLGYSDSNGRLPLTTNSFGPDPNAKFTTTYFRQSFVAGSVASYSNIVLSLQRDDGAVVYLNGAELARFNMPTGAITSATFASANAGDDGGTTFNLDVNPSLIIEGTNVFAVEIHQDAGTSSDIWFVMEMLGVPPIIRNLLPLVAVTNLVDGQTFLGPASISIAAEASDPDGAVAKVEFFAGEVKLGEDTTSPYEFEWSSPAFGPHALRAVATDEQGGSQNSATINIVVYDSVGTPFARVTAPSDGSAFEGGTNLVVTAYASAPGGVTNVQFFANGLLIGEDPTAPYSVVWNAPFGSNGLAVVAQDLNGVTGTSAVVSVSAFPNGTPPSVMRQAPMAGATVTNLTSIAITFSERVQNVDAADLLVNGVAATGVTGSGASYTFSFAQPPYGAVTISWATGHGIADFGFPADLPFNKLGAGAQWIYDLIDRTPPAVAARVPAAGSVATNLQQVRVTFSEPVTGVDATDLIVAGTPAFSVSGSGTDYTFLVSQPNSGTVSVTWATNNGIFDQALTPNAFNGPGGGWSFTLDTRTVLLQSNAVWRFVKGTDESAPIGSAWRQRVFDDSSWSNSPAPFFFGDPYTNFPAGIFGTHLTDMNSNYTTIYLRNEFTVSNRASITNLLINHQSDDGFIAWVNGVEVLRYNMPAGEVPYTGTATGTANEPNQTGAAYISANLPNGPANLVDGVNVLAVQAVNQSLTASSDFGFNAQLYTIIFDPGAVSPRLLTPIPAPGDLLFLTNITVIFSEPVSSVDAADMLINGVAATGMIGNSSSNYTFSFPQPAYGPVAITWATGHGIADFDNPPKPFVGDAPGSTFNYTLFNPGNPRVATQVPLAGNIITSLTSIAVTFTKAVTNVEAADLLVNGVAATNVVSADQITWLFEGTQPAAFGNVAVRWATNHGIQDLEIPANAFDPTRFGGQWNYSFVNPVPTVTITSPTNNAFILAPANIPLRANATDADGTISRVEFFEGAGKVGEATNAPYTITLSDVTQGPYTFRAVATDNTGIMATSAPVSVTVVTSLPIVLVRGPYLQIGTPTSGVVRWRSDLFSDAVVYYGTDQDNLTNVIVRPSFTNEHIISLTDLEPATKYYYSVGNSAQRLADGADFWFNTSPLPGTRKPTRIWALGDAGTAGNGSPDRQRSVRDAFYNLAATNGQTDLVLMLGDNAYNVGSDIEHQAAVFDMYPTTLRNKFLWPTLGNHETSQSTTATDFPYLHIFSLPRDGEAGGVASGTELYYSFDYANIHFVCLDSMTSGRTGTTPMANWLRTDLETTTQDWIIVFFHHPPYTKGSHDSDAEGDLAEIRQNLVPIMETYGVDLVLSGHSHCYERSFLLDGHYGFSGTLTSSMKVNGGDGRESGSGPYEKTLEGRGTVYTVAGSSGQATGGQLNHPAHVISLNELGSAVIDVDGERLDMIFLNSTGDIRDRLALRKPTVPSAPINLVARALGASEITLAWTASSTNETGFIVERSLDGVDFARFLTNGVGEATALDGGLLANATYYYRVRAFNPLGESDPSAIASATTVFATEAPVAPAQLVASSGNAGQAYRSQMFLRWRDHSANEAGFLIERSIDGEDFAPLSTVGANVTLFVDRNLESASEYYYRVRSFNPAGDSAGSNLDGDQTHPQSDLVVAGATATFHAGVEGVSPVRYQWRFMGSALPGETNELLTLANVQAADEGAYTVIVTDANGTETSNPAWLFVQLPPSIVQHPAGQTNIIGAAAVFQVVADGTAPLFYQWRRSGVNLPGASGTQLTIAPLSLADAGDYDAVVMNEFGSVTSRVARLLVTENRPPVLAAAPDFFIPLMTPFVMTNAASDPDATDRLTFALLAGAPTNATLNATNGVFRWTPARAQAPSTNVITVRADDNGIPNLSDTRTFTVLVNDYLEITAGSTVVKPGESNSVPIDIFSSAELLDLQVVLELPGDRLTDLVLESMAPERVAPLLVMSNANTALLTLTSMPGFVMQGTQQVARLHFTAVPGQVSAFVPLGVSAMNATMESIDVVPTPLANDGRVVVLGAESLLEARLTSTGQRQLLVYGKLGTNYTIQSRFGFGAGTSWANRIGVTLTNVPQAVTPPSATAPVIYFRLRQ